MPCQIFVSLEHNFLKIVVNLGIFGVKHYSTYIHIYIHTYIHTYIYTYIHTYIHSFPRFRYRFSFGGKGGEKMPHVDVKNVCVCRDGGGGFFTRVEG